MQSIITKYHGPTNVKGSRVSARASGNGVKVTLSYDHALSAEGNHMAAAQALMAKLDWQGHYIGGHTQDGMVFVCADTRVSYSVEA